MASGLRHLVELRKLEDQAAEGVPYIARLIRMLAASVRVDMTGSNRWRLAT